MIIRAWKSSRESRLSWRVPLPFTAISEKNCHWHGLGSYSFVTIARPSVLSWMNHWWIGDGIVGLGSCDSSLLLHDSQASFFVPLQSLFINDLMCIYPSDRLCKTRGITAYYGAVYRYPLLYLHYVHQDTDESIPLAESLSTIVNTDTVFDLATRARTHAYTHIPTHTLTEL